jgi:hypothetical protein
MRRTTEAPASRLTDSTGEIAIRRTPVTWRMGRLRAAVYGFDYQTLERPLHSRMDKFILPSVITM